MALAAGFWNKHRMASISLAFCILEIIIVWGTVAAVQSPGQHENLLKQASIAWILGSAASIVFAIAAIIFEAQRRVGLMSLVAAVAAFIICGLPMIV
jgi:hypothetical protein